MKTNLMSNQQFATAEEVSIRQGFVREMRQKLAADSNYAKTRQSLPWQNRLMEAGLSKGQADEYILVADGYYSGRLTLQDSEHRLQASEKFSSRQAETLASVLAYAAE